MTIRQSWLLKVTCNTFHTSSKTDLKIDSWIVSFDKYLQIVNYLPSTTLGAVNSTVGKKKKKTNIPAFMKLIFY